MTDDIVAELDRWLAHSGAKRWDAEERMVLRARDEIVALREAKLARPSAYDIVRAEALEEAARACDAHADRPTVHNDTPYRMAHAVVQQSIAASSCATAIRLLKDKSDESLS